MIIKAICSTATSVEHFPLYCIYECSFVVIFSAVRLFGAGNRGRITIALGRVYGLHFHVDARKNYCNIQCIQRFIDLVGNTGQGFDYVYCPLPPGKNCVNITIKKSIIN